MPLREVKFLAVTIFAEAIWQAALLYSLIGLVIYRHWGIANSDLIELIGLFLAPLAVSIWVGRRRKVFDRNRAWGLMTSILGVTIAPWLAFFLAVIGVIGPICALTHFCIDYY